MLTRAQSFYRAMYSRPDLDLLIFAVVCLFVCYLSALRYPYMSSKVTKVRILIPIHLALIRWFSFSKFFLDTKFTVRIIHHGLYFLVEVFIKAMKVSVASLEESSALS